MDNSEKELGRIFLTFQESPAFNHTPARGLQHTRRLNQNITFIYKCSICGRAAGLLKTCD